MRCVIGKRIGNDEQAFLATWELEGSRLAGIAYFDVGVFVDISVARSDSGGDGRANSSPSPTQGAAKPCAQMPHSAKLLAIFKSIQSDHKKTVKQIEYKHEIVF